MATGLAPTIQLWNVFRIPSPCKSRAAEMAGTVCAGIRAWVPGWQYTNKDSCRPGTRFGGNVARVFEGIWAEVRN